MKRMLPWVSTWAAFFALCLGAGRQSTGAESRECFNVPAFQEKGYRWEQVSDRAAFAPRDGAGALVFGGKMWLLGGWNPSDRIHFPNVCNSEVWSSTDGSTWRWTAAGDAAPPAHAP